MTALSPLTKTARQAQIADILTRARVRSQEELAERLAERGVRVTQATLSRDLEELGAVRLRGTGGALVYALPGEPGGPGSRPGGQGAVSAAAPQGGAAGSVPGDRAPESGSVGPAGPPAGRPASGPAGDGEPGQSLGAPQPGPLRDGAQVRWAPLGLADQSSPGALARIAPELLVSAEASANLVVVRTPAGGAQLLASAIDHAGWASILGTVAGDDTVLVIARDPAGGDQVARDLVGVAERRGGR